MVARGGGSAEDLWEFNEEVVARAVAASADPGDLRGGARDRLYDLRFRSRCARAHASAAAELAAPDRAELLRRLGEQGLRLQRCAEAAVRHLRQELAVLVRSGLFREPRLRLDEASQRVDFAQEALRREVRDRLNRSREQIAGFTAFLRQHRPDRLLAVKRERLLALALRLPQSVKRASQDGAQKLHRLAGLLRLLSPAATLERGYALVFAKDGALIRSARELAAGDHLRLRLADGEVPVRRRARQYQRKAPPEELRRRF